MFGLALARLPKNAILSVKVAGDLPNKITGSEIVASGTSCGHQIVDLSGARPKHLAEIIAEVSCSVRCPQRKQFTRAAGPGKNALRQRTLQRFSLASRYPWGLGGAGGAGLAPGFAASPGLGGAASPPEISASGGTANISGSVKDSG
jgi:hypothetical protein